MKTHLIGQSHGGTLDKVRGVESAIQRACNNLLAKIDPLDTMRTIPLPMTVYGDVYNYALPSDYKKVIDLIPEDSRSTRDSMSRVYAKNFDVLKSIKNKEISIESSEGLKYMRVNWRTTNPKTFNTMDSLTGNGTWSTIGTASGLLVNALYKVSGTGSIEFSIATTGDGIKNTTMSNLDLSAWNQLADNFMMVWLGSDYAKLTSINFIFGNDITTKYYTCVAQTTQADGTPFKNGWNLIKNPWATAVQTGTVTSTTIKAASITFTVTGAMSKIRVDSLTFSLGRNFDLKYYSKYLITNTAGTWIPITTNDNDIIVLDSDAINILIYECLIECAQQIEGVDSASDVAYATQKLGGTFSRRGQLIDPGLYDKYVSEYPSQSKKPTNSTFRPRNMNRNIGRW